MGPSTAADEAKKRKKTTSSKDDSLKPSKKPRSEPQPTKNPTLIAPHEAIIARLTPKYDVLAASVISSTQIRKRVTAVTSHIFKHSETSTGPTPVALLHARPADTCKLITISEQCRRLLKEQGKACFQYNQLFDLPPELKKPEVVEKTVLDTKDDEDDSQDDSEDGAFETMESRFEKALLPEPSRKVAKSLRIFLAPSAIPELRAESGVTVQTSEPKQ